MNTLLTFAESRSLADTARDLRQLHAVGVLRAWWMAFYFHAVPHPLSEILYWDLLYVGVRAMTAVQCFAGRFTRRNAKG